jgi:hypothetical protein
MRHWRQRLRNRGKGDNGAAMILAILMGVVFTAVSAGLMANALAESSRSGLGVQRTSALAAAEAGIDDYIAKLTEDHRYYSHYVHPGESTRRDGANVTARAGQAWTGATTWTYPNGRDAWRSLDNGYEFDLQITPPPAGSDLVTITSTGRKRGASTDLRRIEVQVRPASIVDYQTVSNSNLDFGTGTTTRGKLYAGIDQSGVAHHISHSGTAYGDLYAEGDIVRDPTYANGAQGYTSDTIRSVIPTPINFNVFTTALVIVKNTALTGDGIYLDGDKNDGWRLTFNSAGTVTIESCKNAGGKNIAANEPNCTFVSTKPVPTVGAIYTDESVVVSGQVKGKVTVASNADVVVGGNISYVTPGQDVLGLVAKNDVVVAHWAPYDLNFTAAAIAQSGEFRSWASSGDHGSMTFTGSIATNNGISMAMYGTRNFNYDPNLRTLQPPFFPVIEQPYTVLLFRELPPS